jgi:hypothetical protein
MAGWYDTGQQIATAQSRQRDARRLIATGLIAEATILRVRETGAVLGDKLVVEFELLVRRDDDAPYRVGHCQIVSPHVIAQLRPGMTVPVRVDPGRPTSVLIG